MSTNLEVGIVGLPNVGKSTIFNAITNAGAEAAWELKRTLTARDLLAQERLGETALYASDLSRDFKELAGYFLQQEVPEVRRVDIDRY